MDMKELLRGLIRMASIATFLLMTYWVGKTLVAQDEAIKQFFFSFPISLAAIIFIVSYVLSAFVVISLKDVLKVAGALVFGAYWSTFLIWIAELISCWVLFSLAQRWGRARIEQRFHLKGKDVGIIEQLCGVWQVFALRAFPIIPYRILDLAYGLTAIPFRRYFAISALVSPVRIFWVQFVIAGVGGAVFDRQKVMTYLLENVEVVRWLSLYVVASCVAAFIIGWSVKRKHKRSIAQDDDSVDVKQDPA